MALEGLFRLSAIETYSFDLRMILILDPKNPKGQSDLLGKDQDPPIDIDNNGNKLLSQYNFKEEEQ
jgi:hypothetical protein